MVDPGPGKLPPSAISVTRGWVVAQVPRLFHFEANASGQWDSTRHPLDGATAPAAAQGSAAMRNARPPPRRDSDEEAQAAYFAYVGRGARPRHRP
jgi:hypothetical protein